MALLIITGPTASCKSTFAMEIARRYNGEIISADSMQVYQECDIGTAKPTVAEQNEVRHHLIDVISPTERFSAAMWANAARDAIADIRARRKMPVVVGGTGFYLRALLQPESLAQVPPNPALRDELQTLSAPMLLEKLRQIDPVAARRVDPANIKRLIRAIEVASGTKVLSAPAPPIEYRAFALEWPRASLYERINERVDLMMRMGLLDEVRTLVQKYGREAPALDGIGYKEILPVLDNPALLETQIELLKQSTRRYAKRQITWFRHQLDVEWLDPMRQSSEEMEERIIHECS